MKKMLILSIFTTTVLFAEVVNVDAIQNSINVPKEVDNIILRDKNTLITIDGKKEYEPIMVDDKSGKKVFIKDYIFELNDHVSSEYLSNMLNSYKNKELTFNEMLTIASIITKEYRNKGYFIARAYIPKQNIQENNNLLKIMVIEGQYGKFELTNNSNVKDFIVQGMLDDVKNRDNIVNSNTLERSMLLINDLPGSEVMKANIKPGTEIGTSDFIIETKKSSFYNGYIVGDNYGSKYTGHNRLISGIDINSPLKLGDKLELSGLLTNGQDIENYKVGYSFPLMSNGLTSEMSYSKTNYDLVNLGDTTPNGIYYGDTENFELGIVYPFIRSRNENLNLLTYYSIKNLKDYYSDEITNNRETKSLKTALDYSKNSKLFGFNAEIRTETVLTFGILDIKDEISKQQDILGINNQGRYSKINFNLESKIAFNSFLSLNNNLKTQYAFKNKNLDGSEDLNLGGIDGVKVFSDSEQSVENGLIFNMELLTKLFSNSNSSHDIGFFYDLGTGHMSNGSKDTEFEKRTLQDIGIGYYTKYNNLFTKLQVARVIGGQKIETENEGDISKILFQIGYVF